MKQGKITLDDPKKYYAGSTHILPKETLIEVICIKGDRVMKVEMTFGDSLKIEKKPGWIYRNYKLGESQFKLTE